MTQKNKLPKLWNWIGICCEQREGERQRDSETVRQTERQRDRETERQRDIDRQ